jgi:hypothetical protein
MTQAPLQIVVHRQAAKPKQRRCYAQETLLMEKVSRRATPYLGSANGHPVTYKSDLSLEHTFDFI